MPCEDLYYILERQAEKKRLAEIEEMESYAAANNTEISWVCDSANLYFDTGKENPETGNEIYHSMSLEAKDLNMEMLKKFIEECKQEEEKQEQKA